MKRLLVSLPMLLALAPSSAFGREPIIDMHMHADATSDYPPNMYYCVPLMDLEPAIEHSSDIGQQYLKAWQAAECDDPIVPADSDEVLMRQTIERLEANNAIALLQGPPDRVKDWMKAAPGRFIPSIQFSVERDDHEDLGWLREALTNGGFVMLGEVTNQYRGIAPNDPRMNGVWALMEELDVPIGYHMGTGPPGASTIIPSYRVSAGNPILLEDVLSGHPSLRISIQHMATGFQDELKMMLWTYPQLYVELSGPITWSRNFHTDLKALVDAGLENRILFGVDALIWPELLDRSIEIIEGAEYLSEEQKRKILFENAVRFLKLDPEDTRAKATGVLPN
ncbi:amidohydrolase family protein [Qipengyuania nanhaisediminis]|uniref:Amidohydrolase-related domain-containing protein n=1 Tax=Qipengyuania nanhaisediminis TaxID=604088 RepID=A0A1I5KDM1_9SPHN|nr:amidohydrolase family protein [Qipengyuania nanhaisediminis]SFO83078.1 hypothetical protein SAMN04488060_0120 [Qipengyuania nanhaisediminis]